MNNLIRNLAVPFALSMLVILLPTQAMAGFVAYNVDSGAVGTQEFGASLGLDFIVNEPILVTQLGIFDSGSDGLGRDITADLWSRNDGGTPDDFSDDAGIDKLATLLFTSNDPGTLVNGNRLKPLASSLVLSPGAYTIVGHGYGAGEPNGNTAGPADDEKAVNDGGGLITFVGDARFGDPATPGSFPGSKDGGPVNRYAAGTFEFQVVPEPATSVLALLAIFMLLGYGARHRQLG